MGCHKPCEASKYRNKNRCNPHFLTTSKKGNTFFSFISINTGLIGNTRNE